MSDDTGATKGEKVPPPPSPSGGGGGGGCAGAGGATVDSDGLAPPLPEAMAGAAAVGAAALGGDAREVEIDSTKSPQDKKAYRYIVLPNGLAVLLISEASTVGPGRLPRLGSGGSLFGEDSERKTPEVDERAGGRDRGASDAVGGATTGTQHGRAPGSTSGAARAARAARAATAADSEDSDDDDDDEDETEALASQDSQSLASDSISDDGTPAAADGDDLRHSVDSESIGSRDRAAGISGLDGDIMPQNAAVALAVSVGSFSDPNDVHGLAHFLEHMLFMGSAKYPKENAYDGFLSEHGGSSNAHTDAEQTVYHFDVHPNYLEGALDRFAAFFISPQWNPGAAGREIHAIQSEFEQARNSDDARIGELRCLLSQRKHPLSKFGWGNMESLDTVPKERGVDVHASLLQFFEQYYVAQAMALVIRSTHSLDELTLMVQTRFQALPSGPPGFFPPSFESAGLPFKGSTPGLLRIAPISATHTLSLVWAFPPMKKHYRCKPDEYLAHLIGHEAQGSILSVLKSKGLAVELSAGVDGMDDFSACAIFAVEIELTAAGMVRWCDVATLVFQYLKLLRGVGVLGWVQDELRRLAKLRFRFQEEDEPTEQVERLVEVMGTRKVPAEQLLMCETLYDDLDEALVASLLDHFTANSVLVELSSPWFDPDPDRAHDSDEIGLWASATAAYLEEDHPKGSPSAILNGSIPLTPDGMDSTERWFGTRFARHSLPKALIRYWNKPPSNSELTVPPRNPFIPDNLSLHPHPDDMAAALNPDGTRSSIAGGPGALRVEGAADRLHLRRAPVPASPAAVAAAGETVLSADVGGADAGVEEGKEFSEGAVSIASASSADTSAPIGGAGTIAVVGGVQRVVSETEATMTPPSRILADAHGKLWHKQDRAFRLPHANVTFLIYCPRTYSDARGASLTDLFCRVVMDLLNETLYLASMADLDASVRKVRYGVELSLNGYNDKMPRLLLHVLERLADPSLPADRVAVAREELLRWYTDRRVKPLSHAKYERLLCLQNTNWTLEELSSAAHDVTPRSLNAFAAELFSGCFVEGFVHGNVTRSQAVKLMETVQAHTCLRSPVGASGGSNASEGARAKRGKGKGRKKGRGKQRGGEAVSPTRAASGGAGGAIAVPMVKDADCGAVYPAEHVAKLDHGKTYIHRVPSVVPTNVNSVVENYYQLGPDSLELRVATDMLEQVMQEPLFDVLRTKQQLGYRVDCGTRLTGNVVGFCIRVQSSEYVPEILNDRVERFLRDFRPTLAAMSDRKFAGYVEALVEAKLRRENNLTEESDRHWAEIESRRYEFDACASEAAALRRLPLDRVVAVFDAAFSPERRRKLSVRIVGNSRIGAGRGSGSDSEDDSASEADSDSDAGVEGVSEVDVGAEVGGAGGVGAAPLAAKPTGPAVLEAELLVENAVEFRRKQQKFVSPR